MAPDLDGREAAEAARELAVRLRAAQDDAQKAATLAQQKQREEGRLRAAEAQRAEAKVCLERLCQEAGCTGFDQLPEAERRSQDLARLEADLGACEEQLLIVAAGADLVALRRRGRAGRSRRAGLVPRGARNPHRRHGKATWSASIRPSAPSGR